MVASQLYLIHAAFFAHALKPVGVYVVDPHTHLHVLPGRVGNIEAVFHWDGLTQTMLISVLVFVIAWAAARKTAALRANTGSKRVVHPNSLIPTRPSHHGKRHNNHFNRRNRLSGTTDKIKGRVKEAVGALTNDKRLKKEGSWIKQAGQSRTFSTKRSTT
jgi:uncharacterized protein YjbJ (UPF0337 family)